VVDVEEYCFEGTVLSSSNISSNMPVAAASTNANMSAKIAAALNQGFSSLGGRLGKPRPTTSSSPPRLSDREQPDVEEEEEEERCCLLSREGEKRVEREQEQLDESLEASAGPLACRPCVSVNTLATSSPSPPLLASKGEKEGWERGEDSGIATSLHLLPITSNTSRGPN
jgi:hypothetical protein